MKSRHLSLLALALAFTSFLPHAKAQNLISNGTFTGNATGWVQYGSTSYTGFNANNFYEFGSTGDLSFLSQSFATTIGHNYTVSFDLQSPDASLSSQFTALFGDNTIAFTTPTSGFDTSSTLGLSLLFNDGGPANFVGVNIPAWTNFSYNVTAATSSSQVLFAGKNYWNWYNLDNVVVTDNGEGTPNSAVPEPSTYGLMGAGALGAFALLRRRRAAKQAA